MENYEIGSGTIGFGEFFKVITHIILNWDTEDEILKAFRLLDDHETSSGTIGFEEFVKIMIHIILNRDTEEEILKAFIPPLG